MRVFKAFLGTTFVIAGLVVASMTALAQSATQSTTLSLTVPTAISFTGLAASYSGTLTPGGTTNIFMGNGTTPLSVSTNNSLGYHLTIAATAADFVGTASASNLIPDADDSVQFCANPAGSSCGGTGQTAFLSTTAQTIRNTSTSATDSFGVVNSITIPGTQAADTYTGTLTLVATTN